MNIESILITGAGILFFLAWLALQIVVAYLSLKRKHWIWFCLFIVNAMSIVMIPLLASLIVPIIYLSVYGGVFFKNKKQVAEEKAVRSPSGRKIKWR